MAEDFVNLHTNKGIRTHPLHLPSQGGEAVEVVGLIGEVDRDNVRLVLVRTREPAETQSRHQVAALISGHFTHQHVWHPPLRVGTYRCKWTSSNVTSVSERFGIRTCSILQPPEHLHRRNGTHRLHGYGYSRLCAIHPSSLMCDAGHILS